jgi:hypothetical protein
MEQAPPDRLTAREMAEDRRGHGCFAIDAAGQVRSFTPSIRDALIARGVLYRDGGDVWRLTWADFDLEARQAAWMACCDFCSARPVVFEVECPTFAMPDAQAGGRQSAPAISQGNWMACEACGQDVIAGRRAALLARSLPLQMPHELQLAEESPEAGRRFRHAVTVLRREIHARFWRRYTGRITPVAPHPFGH